MIRPATTADAPAICALWNGWITDTTVTFTHIPKLLENVIAMIAFRQTMGRAFVVADDGGVVGFASYDQFRAGDGYTTCMEHSVMLAPQVHSRGMGRALVTAIEDHARNAGAHQMIAGVTGENAAGRAFHERLGYRPIATIPEAGFKFGRHIDLLLMQKFL